MKDIKGYEGLYAVKRDGTVWSYPSFTSSNPRYQKIHCLKPRLDGRGYGNIMLYKNGETKQFLIHRLIAKAFLKNPNNFPEIDHKDSIKLNNQLSNLEWVTSSENKIRAWKNGLYEFARKSAPKGMKNGNAKLTDEIVKMIRKRSDSGENHRIIAMDYKVSRSTVTTIHRRVSWKHIS